MSNRARVIIAGSGKRISKGPCIKCKSSDAYEVYEDGHSHCYSCGFHKHPEINWESLQKSLGEGNKKKQSWLSLPEDFDYYLPTYAATWLDKYNLTEREKRKNRIGFSEKRQSIIFPVFGESVTDLTMYQERYFGDDPAVPKWITKGYKNDVIHLPDQWSHDIIVLVEDIISAIKVSRVTNCMPIFGSTLSEDLARKIVKLFKRARVWLDPDAKAKAIETSLLLSELGLPSSIIFSSKDPKEYVTADIRELVDPLRKD